MIKHQPQPTVPLMLLHFVNTLEANFDASLVSLISTKLMQKLIQSQICCFQE